MDNKNTETVNLQQLRMQLPKEDIDDLIFDDFDYEAVSER